MPRNASPRIAAGQPARDAVPRLVDQYGPTLYALALRLCRGPDDAEDLVQEVFLIALRKWPQFRGDAPPRAWLFSIAMRACRRRHRRRAGQPVRMASLDAVMPFDEASVAVLDESPDRRESIGALQQAIVGLPDAFRMPLILRDIAGLTVEEVANVLGLKTGTVKARLHRTRLRLRKAVLETLPSRTAGPPAYDLQTCLDLMRAKQDALDRGVPFRRGDRVICERCRSFFDTLDLTHELCARLAQGEIPSGALSRLRARVQVEILAARSRAVRA